MSTIEPEATLGLAFRARALRFARSLIVGSWGTALDFAALTVGVRHLHVDATWARVAGLCAGSVVLFFGSRSFAFRAQSEDAGPQATRFAISELIGFPLNVLVFRLLLYWLPTVPPEALSLAANFALFVTYYYPVRNHVVFKARPALLIQPVAARP